MRNKKTKAVAIKPRLKSHKSDQDTLYLYTTIIYLSFNKLLVITFIHITPVLPEVS